jgi:hypothetical protein
MICMINSRPKYGMGPFLKLFRCSNNCIGQKVYFLRLRRVYVVLIMLGRVLSPSFFASYWSAGFRRFLQVLALGSHWLGIVQILHQRRRKTNKTALTTLSAGQATSQSTFIN